MTEEIDIPTHPEGEGGGRNNTLIIIAVVVLVLLCCCCGTLVAAWYGGDSVIEYFGLAFQTMQGLV